MALNKMERLNKPVFRKLRGYAFDPSLSIETDTVQVNHITYKIEWEELEEDPANPEKTIPCGEYVEIIDYDPASGLFYQPVDLNDRYLLAQDGLHPSVSNPQFHQQMVYAVVMLTIKNFEQALGRKIQWSDHRLAEPGRPDKIRDSEFVRRLRIYPHALRQANAYYHPMKKALLFGYFTSRPANPGLQLPGGIVFTCLSHDIIAHETTHAILDGLHRRYIEANHPDTRAFHEAFADMVALFQHFSFPEVLNHQIARTRGDLGQQNLLGQLAEQFGRAVGGYSSLRDAIGRTDEATGQWVPAKPDPSDYATKMECHERGAILVAAVFDAFITLYKQRIQKLLHAATGGSGILADGDLHPVLVDLLAETAADTASRILRICVRALDYCPPMDLTYGDFLRAVITADLDMVADDEKNYRVAFIEAFQKRGIFPAGVRTMSVETLAYEALPELMHSKENMEVFSKFLREFKEKLAYEQDREAIYLGTEDFIKGSKKVHMGLHDRINVKFLRSADGKLFAGLSGLLFPPSKEECAELGFSFSERTKSATYQIENLWLANRVSPDGKIINHVIVTMLQRRGVRMSTDAKGDIAISGYFDPNGEIPDDGFIFRGGATLIFDLDNMQLKYVISKNINDQERMKQQYRFSNGLDGEGPSMYFDKTALASLSGPFALMHSFNL
ncbi:MAG: hypothetical protein J0H74_22130 [Chitinophagaceae bacterium]|nr:hypothetical protein [Chitinophagaceae bacterium]